MGNQSGLIPRTRPGGGLPGANRPGLGGLPGITTPGGIGANHPGLVPQPRPTPRPGTIAGNRPGGGTIGGNRPGAGGGGEQWAGRPDRPGTGGIVRPERPGAGGGGEQWAGLRPGDNNRPGAGGGGEQWRPGDNNRPGWRPGDNNRPNGWNNRPIVNRPDNSINTNINNDQFVNNQQFYGGRNPYVSGYGGGYGGYAGYGYPGYGGYGSLPYYGNGYTDWYHGSWSNWSAPLAAWTAAAATNSALGWLSAANSFVYSNPYYVAPATTIVQPVYDYADPIPVLAPDQTTDSTLATIGPVPQPLAASDVDAAPTVTAPPAAAGPDAAAAPDPKAKAAIDAFAAARDSFKAGDYVRAQTQVETAIRSEPADPVMHEFRALALFAQGKYREAAATLYAVLARGPGWDWDTMLSLYPDADTYTRQLRALEETIREHPSDGAARFVLAYHYLVTRQTDAAVRQLREVVKLTPDNTLAADMIKALTTAPTGGDVPKAGQ
jgi:hypothetical protein